MANSKYFHVRHLVAGTDFIAKAPKATLALVAIAGTSEAVKPATDDQIATHFAGGGTLHDKSLAEGEGKLFFVATTPSVLIRAKNEADAFSRLNDGVYSAEPASQDTLVRLLTNGVKPVEYVEPEKGKKTAGNANARAGESGSAQSEGTGAVTAVG